MSDLIKRVREVVDVMAGEVWAPAMNTRHHTGGVDLVTLDDFAVSTEGRAVSLPRTTRQASRNGSLYDLRRAGGLLSPCMGNTRIGYMGGPLVDVGRAVLTAFDRPPVRQTERAVRVDMVRFHTSLANLAWSSEQGIPDAIRFFERLVEFRQPTVAREAAAVGSTQAFRWMDEAERETRVGRRFGEFPAAGLEFFRGRAREIERRRRAAVERWAEEGAR